MTSRGRQAREPPRFDDLNECIAILKDAEFLMMTAGHGSWGHSNETATLAVEQKNQVDTSVYQRIGCLNDPQMPVRPGLGDCTVS
jgi:hypothetical protein